MLIIEINPLLNIPVESKIRLLKRLKPDSVGVSCFKKDMVLNAPERLNRSNDQNKSKSKFEINKIYAEKCEKRQVFRKTINFFSLKFEKIIKS